MTCKARLEEAGVGWVVLLWHDLADVLDRDAAGDVKADLVGGGLVAPDGSLTARGEEARRAALRLLAERQVSSARIEALAAGDVARWAAMAKEAEAVPDTDHSQACSCSECALVWGRAERLQAHAPELVRTAVPALCAEVRRLRAALAAVTEERDVLRSSGRVAGLPGKPEPYHAGDTPEQRERAGYEVALVTLAAWTCITGRPEDAARAFGGLLGAAGESEDGRRGAARALRHLAAVLEGQPVPATTVDQDVDALRREAERAEEVAVENGEALPRLSSGLTGRGRGIRRALDVLAPHLPPPRGAR